MKNLITKRLHHRPPYLLLDEILEISSNHLYAVKIPRIHEFYLQGHFPGTPIVPGAMMQEMTTQAAGLLITEYYSPIPDYDSEKTKGHALGVLRSVHQAKFKKFARPDQILNIKVNLIDSLQSSFRFKGSIEIEGEKIMTNEFTLINITEEQLKGV
jgi:3-hydroxyacyl-[acyl-carrier-protein] dehydratase